MNYNRALEILEISQIELNLENVKRKYRMMALLYHPDKNSAPDAQEHFQNINSAYEYLINYLKHRHEDDTESENNDIELDNEYKFSYEYRDILIQFLRGISESGMETNNMFYNVIHKITEKCEEKSLELLGKLNKELLLKTYDILYKHGSIFRVSEDFVLKVQRMVEDRMKHDECIILNPTLEDLFSKNIYKLVVGDQTLLIPLWHHELVYEIGGADLYVKCIPILPDYYTIDSENNIIIELQYNICDLLVMESIKIVIGDRKFTVPIEEFRIVKRQKLCMSGAGIPRIVSGDIYNINRLGDIILDILLL